MTKVGPCPGQVAASNMTLDDGRPAWIAMDVGAFNHVSPGIAAINIDTLRVVKQTTLRSERWFDLPTRRGIHCPGTLGLIGAKDRAKKGDD